MNIFFKRKMYYFISVVFLIFFNLSIVNAGVFDPQLTNKLDPEKLDQTGSFALSAGIKSGSVGDIVGVAVGAFLGFLGTVFLVLMVIGGWKYMMARGNEEKVTEALGLMRRAIIGLIIVAGAYSITYFVFNAIDWVGSGGGGNGGGGGGMAF